MRHMRSALITICCVVPSLLACRASAAEPGPDQRIVIAVTRAAERPPTTAVSLLDPRSGAVSELYRDPKEGRRILGKIGGSDVLGAVRMIPPGDIFAVVGPAVAESSTSLDDISLLLTFEAGRKAEWEQLAQIPLCFSEASPYGMWNRAPLLAISPDRSRVAITALRAGEIALAAPAIRVLTMYGAEEWQMPLPGKAFRVVDLAWSPDSSHLAYAVLPLGDEHTLDESLLPQAGVYLADVPARTALLLHHCYPAALAWAPKADHISIAVQPDVWSWAAVVRTISFPAGKRLQEFSVPGSAEAIAYSDDGRWLAVQLAEAGAQTVQIRAAAGGWGHSIYRLAASDGRLALLGWVQIPEGRTDH